MSKRFSIVIIFMIATLIFSKNSLAQALDSGIEEILVTAERSEQSIQDVPIAVSAFGSDALELQQIETFGDLQFNIPSITYTRGTLLEAVCQLEVLLRQQLLRRVMELLPIT